MSDLNAVEIKGTVMYEPNVKNTRNDSIMSTFSVCVKHKEPSKAKDYLNVIAWGDVANQVKEEFHAGKRIGVQGHLRKQFYMQDENKRTVMQIVAEKIYHPDDEY